MRSPELATPTALPAVSTSDTGRAPAAPNVTLASVDESCRQTGAGLVESALTEKADRAAAIRCGSGDGRVSAKLAGNPRGISVDPLAESALTR